MTVERPTLPPDFDDSRARQRRSDPAAWRFSDGERAAVWRALAERRDIRRFRPEAVPDELLARLLEAAHLAPSVGLMQPWRFVVIRDERTKAAMQALAARERLVQAGHLDVRARQYLDLKLEGIREAPVSVCVCCDRAPGVEVLGRHTITDTDLYSTCLAIENLWLAARAEGIGVGWVSLYREADLRELLRIPEHVVPVAWLCIGYPDERPLRPGLEAQGWDARHPLEAHVFSERWGAAVQPHGVSEGGPGAREPGLYARPRHESHAQVEPYGQRVAAVSDPGAERLRHCRTPEWWERLADAVEPGDAGAGIGVRDASDELIKPAGSLGILEAVLERWAAATGAPPTGPPSTGILVLCADHGVAAHGVSLFPARVGAQVAAAAARGESAIGVLARELGAELIVADVGLRGPRVGDGVRDVRVANGSADMSAGPALDATELRGAVEAGWALGDELASRYELVVLGEIGIGNTTAASALLAALTGFPVDAVCGRGTGLDAQGIARKRAVVAAALAANQVDRDDPIGCLRAVGGLELAALAGAMLAAASRRRMVLLDGFAVGVVALTACRACPDLRDYLLAGHRSAEPAHAQVLVELGLEPLLDGRLRLGEASGAALAVPLIGLAGRLHAGMGRFAESGVERAG